MMDCFSRPCASFGLTINVNKTLVMYQPALNKRFEDPAIFLYGKRLKFVDHFVYLVSTRSQDNSLDWEISLSLQKSTRSFALVEKGVWSQRDIKCSSKLGVIPNLCAHCLFVRMWDLSCIYIYIYTCIFINPLRTSRMRYTINFSSVFNRFEFSFSSLRLVIIARLKNPVCPTV